MITIGFIGAGNMARSIIGGLVSQGTAGANIIASDVNSEALVNLAETFGICTTTNNASLAAKVDILILAVKPQVLAQVCEDLGPTLKQDTLVISIAAGITTKMLRDWLGKETKLVRCMPNTPALIQQGATGLYADASVGTELRNKAEAILQSVGIVQWVAEEALIDTVTAVSGSGPAYFFYFLESIVQAGIMQGLDASVARELAVQTAKGAAELAQTSDEDLGELRRKVTSPGGTTERAIQSFEQDQLKEIIIRAMAACSERSRELANNS